MRLLSLACTLALGATLAFSASAATPLPAGGDAIVSKTLPNGLKIIVWPDHDIPNANYYTTYRVGSRNERPGITGLAHFFEHMMFNGTTRRPQQGSFDKAMEAAGGSNNAWTSEDLTSYTDWFPSAALETIFDLESDRMANLAFDPKVVESERGVVYSERRLRVDNDNFGALLEQLQAAAFTAHPYQMPVIGWPSDIEGWKQADLEQFFKTYYAPNNAVLVIAGDVEPAQVFALADKYLAPLKAQPAPTPVTTVEPEQQGERRVVVEKAEAQTPLLAYAFHTGFKSTDAKASSTLDLLVNILSSGESSRLHQRLVEREQAAIAAGANFGDMLDPGIVLVYAVLPPGGDVANVEKLLDEELARIAAEGVSAVELDKARNQMSVRFWNKLATINGKASTLGWYELFRGDYRTLFEAPNVYASVGNADVQALAKRIFQARNRTVGLLKPAADTTDSATGKEAAQ